MMNKTNDIPGVVAVASDGSDESLDLGETAQGDHGRILDHLDLNPPVSQSTTHVIPIDAGLDSTPRLDARSDPTPGPFSSSPALRGRACHEVPLVKTDNDDDGIISSLALLHLRHEESKEETIDEWLLWRKSLNQKLQHEHSEAARLPLQAPTLVRKVSIEADQIEQEQDYSRSLSTRNKGLHIVELDDEDLRRQVGSNDYDRNDTRDGPETNEESDEQEVIRGFYFDQMDELRPCDSCE